MSIPHLTSRVLLIASSIALATACIDVDEPNATTGETTAATNDESPTSSASQSDSGSTTTDDPSLADSSTDPSGSESESGTTTTGVDVDRGPTELPIDGDANGLWWDADDATLYIADDNANRILSWDDTNGFGVVADLPLAPEDGAGLGQLVRIADGSFVVTRFGFGTAGDVVVVPPDADAYSVPNLDPERRRIGLTVTADGTLYDSWFIRVGEDRVGSIGELDLEGSEVVVIDGLIKPVAVVAEGDDLIVVDQDLGQILRAPIASPADYEVVASDLVGADLLGLGPDGSYFIGGADGSIRQISADGAVDVFAGGFITVRGVAYDAANTRLFAAEHDDDESDGLEHSLQILPVDPA